MRKRGIQLRSALDHGVKDLDVAGPAELPELGEGSLSVEKRVRFHPDEDGAVGGLHLSALLAFGKLAFECRDEGGEVQIQLGGAPGGEGQPEASFRIFGDEVGGVDVAGESSSRRLQGAETRSSLEQREVRQVVRGEVFAGQVGVNQAESPEAAGRGTETV